MHQNILFDLGLVLILGFFAALLMKKIGQSVIVGYMIAGLLIGPNVLNLISNTDLLSTLSELGIVFLMFFLGLEFSINKFNKIKNSVFFIGTYEVILNLIVGYILGSVLGFALKDNLFLAGIIAFSSSSVVAKLLFEMRRTASKESEILMGVMVFEDFFAIVFLGVLTSFSSTNTINIANISLSIVKAIGFYAVFIILGIFLINKVIDLLLKIDSQELFTSLMLGIILLTGSLAVYFGLASAAGAFLLGMIINSYDVEERLHRTISSFKDIFLLVFFITFGMLLDPRQMPSVLWLIAIAVPVTIIAELIITSSAALISGFRPKSAVSIGASMISRGEYSMIFASLGFLSGTISETIYQFTGVYVFVMTLLAPIAMKNSNATSNLISKTTPGFLKYSLKLVSATMKPLLLPEEAGIKIERSYRFLSFFALYLVTIITAFFSKTIYILLIIGIIGILIVYELRRIFRKKIKELEEQIDYQSIHKGAYNFDSIIRFISSIFSALLIIVLLGTLFWNFGSTVLILLLSCFMIYLLVVSIIVYRKRNVKT